MHNPHEKSRKSDVDAVNAVRGFLEHEGLIFQEIDLRNDIGKDAILDLAAEGPDAGLSVALQIKGGREYKRKHGHAIRINTRLRRVWSASSMPVFVMVHDPDDGEVYWGNLGEMAISAEKVPGSLKVVPDRRLTPDGLDEFLGAVRLECLKRRGDPVLNLVRVQPELQQSALFDCLALGRTDARYLKCVRDLLGEFRDRQTLYNAIHLLAHATPHPDIFWHKGNIISQEVESELKASLTWTPTELAMLLSRLPDEEMWGRGTIGQSLCMILLQDPSLEWCLERVILEAFRADEPTWRSCFVRSSPFGPRWVDPSRQNVIWPALTLAIYLAENPTERLTELVARIPKIEKLSMYADLVEVLMKFGAIEIF